MDKFDKLKLASSSFSERVKISTKMVSTKMKDLLTPPTPESKLVEEATLETLQEPNWGLNLRICTMINREEIKGSEIVRAIKKKLLGKSVVGQRLSLDLIEACTTNCDKVSSEVASERVLDDMVRMIEDVKGDDENRGKAMGLIRAWAESPDLDYLPVFRQTYETLKTKGLPSETSRNSESQIEQQASLSPPLSYPVPPMGMDDGMPESFVAYSLQSVEEKKEFLVITRNSIEILSSILNTEGDVKPIKEELTVSMYEKCKRSLPVIQRIIQNTSDDEVMLFDALNLHDELQQITSRYEELAAALESGSPKISVPEEHREGSDIKEAKSSMQDEDHTSTASVSGLPRNSFPEDQQEGSDIKEAKSSMQDEDHTTTDKAESYKEDKTESSSEPKSTEQGRHGTSPLEAHS